MSKTLQKRDSFWGHFDDLFESMDGMFEKMPDLFTAMDFGKGTSTSVTTLYHNGKQVEVKTKNGKTTVKVNGELYSPVKNKDKKSNEKT